MNSENPIRKIYTDIIGPNVGKGEAVLCLLSLAAIIFMAMELRYDINVKVGPVDIALTQKSD
jgi:hypothetical protein